VDDVDVSPRLAPAIPGARRPLARRLAYPAASAFIHDNRASQSQFAARYAGPSGRYGGSLDICRTRKQRSCSGPRAHAVTRVLLDGELQARLSSNIWAAERGELDWRNTADALTDLYSEYRLQR
jgi:hypothetical protein